MRSPVTEVVARFIGIKSFIYRYLYNLIKVVYKFRVDHLSHGQCSLEKPRSQRSNAAADSSFHAPRAVFLIIQDADWPFGWPASLRHLLLLGFHFYTQ
jgi:hypothetical protein